jgi:hypothetical protein
MGSGYRVFTSGEVLTASNVQNYLQDQAVMVFAGTAARSSAIGTANFEEGMLTYLTDVDKLQVYTGATFADVYPAAASTQGLTLINTTSFSGVSSQSINDVFSATYDTYKIILSVDSRSTSNSLNLRMRVAGADNSSNNYSLNGIYWGTTSQATYDSTKSNGNLSNWTATVASATESQSIIELINPFRVVKTSYALTNNNFNGTDNLGTVILGIMNVTTSYTGFTFFPNTGTITGNVSVYGYNK